MKKPLLLAVIVLLYGQMLTAQVVYNESFDNYTIGNLGTDPTGVVPGQGGWLTEMFQTVNNNYATITAETNKGKVLTLSSAATSPYKCNLGVKKTDIDLFINQRSAGNNVLKFEIEYFTGAQHGKGSSSAHQRFGLFYDPTKLNLTDALIQFLFQSTTGEIGVICKDQTKLVYLDNNPNNNPNHHPTVPFNTWITFTVYLDYNNKKAYFQTPYFNTVAVSDFLINSTSKNLIDDFKPSVLKFTFSSDVNTTQVFTKFDNIKITALKNVPPEVLSTNSFLSEKFNLFPNPATDLVNITNSDVMVVNQVEIYDVTGKLINTQKFSNETEIQLNVETLNSGTYLLHLHTNEGIAVKKLIKK